MKILYLTVPSFFDLDISLVREVAKFVDVHVMLVLSPQSLQSSAFSLSKMLMNCDIIPANDYPEMYKYKDVIDLKIWSIANNPDNSLKSCFSLVRKLKKYIKNNNFDLIHTTTLCKTVFFFMPFLALHRHTLLTVHDPIPHKKLSWIENFFRRKMFYRANKNILLLSKSLLEKFYTNYNFDKRNVFFSTLGVYDVLTRYSSMNNHYGEYILFFGRIESYKGVDQLIDAYEKSSLPQKRVKLVVAGKGYINHNTMNLSDNVILLNRFIENSELANLIRNCKYVVLPYLTATQSGCVMSAFAFNKPVLATNVGDFPLTIKDGELGIICEPNDVNGLTKAIEKMNEANLELMAQNIKDKYQNNGECSWICIAKSLCNVYQHIIK